MSKLAFIDLINNNICYGHSYLSHLVNLEFCFVTPPASTYEANKYDAEKAWKEHQDRMKEIERR